MTHNTEKKEVLDKYKISINTDGPTYCHPPMFTLEDMEFWSSAEELNKERQHINFVSENR